MRNNCYSLLLLLVLFALSSCSKDDGPPLTGVLRLVVSSNLPVNSSYELYSEASWSLDKPVSPLLQGQFTSTNVVVIRNLNTGNYIVGVSGYYKQVQVTAGSEREYKF